MTFGTNVGEFNTTGIDEFEGFVHVLRLLNSHPRIFVISSERDVAWVE